MPHREQINGKPRRGRPPSDDLTIRKLRSAISNGSKLLPKGDHRLPHMRRLADLFNDTCADCGGHDVMSTGQLNHASQLELEAAQWPDGVASPGQFRRFQTGVNTHRRLCESLGINRGRIARTFNGSSVVEVLRQGHQHYSNSTTHIPRTTPVGGGGEDGSS
jgi:hypothetical protein